MKIYISCAKTMTSHGTKNVPFTSKPLFYDQAVQNVMDISRFSSDELGKLLKINTKLAAENIIAGLKGEPLPAEVKG